MGIIGFFLVLFLILSIVGIPEVGPWNHGFGYYPSAVGFLIVIVLIVLLLRGRIG